ncbi:MAG: hypothetical protein ABI177_09555 [Edaphobacter sp.]
MEIATIERADLLSPATVGLTIPEGKTIMERLQRRMVAVQVERQGVSMKSCSECGAVLRTKGHYTSMLRTVYGNVPMRVLRLRRCACASDSGTRSTVFTNHFPVTPKLRYLTAKLAALMPFGKVADFLSEMSPITAKMTAGTVRNRTMRVGARLQKSAESLSAPASQESCERAVVGLGTTLKWWLARYSI